MIATQGALHPGFNTFDNDIGLLFMPRNIPFMGKKLQNNHLLFQYECVSQPDCEVVRTIMKIWWGTLEGTLAFEIKSRLTSLKLFAREKFLIVIFYYYLISIKLSGW